MGIFNEEISSWCCGNLLLIERYKACPETVSHPTVQVLFHAIDKAIGHTPPNSVLSLRICCRKREHSKSYCSKRVLCRCERKLKSQNLFLVLTSMSTVTRHPTVHSVIFFGKNSLYVQVRVEQVVVSEQGSVVLFKLASVLKFYRSTIWWVLYLIII